MHNLYEKFPMLDSFVSLLFGGMGGYFIPQLISTIENHSFSFEESSFWGTIVLLSVAFFYYFKMSPYATKRQGTVTDRSKEKVVEALGERYKHMIENSESTDELDKISESFHRNVTTVNNP